jgi:dynein heavy chain
MIWEHSKFYKSNERISGLLHKISNEIIKRCKQQINVDDMLDGDVEKCIEDLKDSITCGRKWRQIYDKMASTISKKYSQKWDFSLNSIFAQVEAFVQRCSELIEICEGQLQFAMRGSNVHMPKFGGSRSGEIVNILLEIKASFRKLIEKFRSSEKDKILDVKASTWHEEYNSFKAGMKELDVMYQNVIDYSFKQMTTVEQGVEMLEAFDYLAKRDSIRACVGKKANDVMALFMSEV